jgi:hypothetical protein
MKKAASAVGGIILMVCGTGFILLCIFGYFRGSATEGWVSAKGTVMAVEMDRKFLKKGSRGHKTPQYNVVITYAYDVEGLRYGSDRHSVSFIGLTGHISGSRHYLEEILKINAKYYPGAEIEVFHDPDDPERAVLEKGYQGYLPTYIVFGLIAIGVGVYLAIRGFS